MFRRSKARKDFEKAEKLNVKNREDIRRIETQDLTKVKKRQAEIEKRLASLQTELDTHRL